MYRTGILSDRSRWEAQPLVLTLEAMVWLCVFRLLLIVWNFPTLARRFGHLHPPDPAPLTRSGSTREQRTVLAVAEALPRASRRLPFRSVCLPRALAGWQMLHRRKVPVRLHFGATRDPARPALWTHAWLDACGLEVSGYATAKNFTEIGYYTP